MGLFSKIGQRVKERQKQRQEFKLEKERIVQSANIEAYANGVQPAQSGAAAFAGTLSNVVDKAGEFANNFIASKSGFANKFTGAKTKETENKVDDKKGEGKKDNSIMFIVLAIAALFMFKKS